MTVERDAAKKEADQFREDVDYLTKEVSDLLEDYKEEKAERQLIQRELQDSNMELKDLKLRF